MINKRGLSPSEFEEIDQDLLNALMVYDQYIEPSGTKMDMYFHAHLCHMITMNNPGMTKELSKKIRMSDYDFLGLLDDSKTTQERYEERIKPKDQQSEIEKIGNMIKAQIQNKRN
ncbi:MULTISPECIES: hypothetical protein [Klebsiella/Raoultella group]|jgi:aminopeptidase-like protein|uniref:Uncharacterized protein n=1 Tax=Raoultella ornithinolytica TaxID=54291 RepID=A0A9Q9J824_RAOOR|nr:MULTISPECIES: hypothetical protein [Klebsiella/Raoultella group]MBN2959401.1 hypothetical protein [Streptococcus gordonii]MDU4226400.1 hypothetical protein [Klebsiella grimontii]HDT5883435.1 hypothetical protein [Klebsiella pneumoniae subsp. pneumoniae]EJG2384141.1 hypothetical protein [Raoultella ornithinolytica]EKW7683057.1 hypothetical protein [Raoultella ornithinolytica]